MARLLVVVAKIRVEIEQIRASSILSSFAIREVWEGRFEPAGCEGFRINAMEPNDTVT
ncbi:uncharacterized protein G2W53_037104 [Senna tora]|uniref:Uncharacterized protein n=1 Tax=Senna tora TaxID=362788 RepID=A0A834SWN1_9FABA|nr:uncharacterized protein G2W53_037104 [Senna tora]